MSKAINQLVMKRNLPPKANIRCQKNKMAGDQSFEVILHIMKMSLNCYLRLSQPLELQRIGLYAVERHGKVPLHPQVTSAPLCKSRRVGFCPTVAEFLPRQCLATTLSL